MRLALGAVDRRKGVQRHLNRTTLLGLLRMYEGAIKDLEETRDPGVAGLIRRLERHRAELIAALDAQDAA